VATDYTLGCARLAGGEELSALCYDRIASERGPPVFHNDNQQIRHIGVARGDAMGADAPPGEGLHIRKIFWAEFYFLPGSCISYNSATYSVTLNYC